jgi:ribosomal subunit interface protein
MDIPLNIKGTNIELNDSLRIYLEKRLQKLEHFINESETAIIAEVELGKITTGQRSGDIFRAEINLEIGGKLLRAESEQSDIHAAIDDMQEEIVRELKKFKDKRTTLFRKGARRIKNMVRGFRRE